MTVHSADYRVIREYLCRLLHDANTGKICPDDSDPTKYGAMADAILSQGEYALVKVGKAPPWMKPSAAWFYGHRDIDSLIQWEPGLSDDHTVLYEIDTAPNDREDRS